MVLRAAAWAADPGCGGAVIRSPARDQRGTWTIGHATALCGGEKWLQVLEYQQSGQTEFVNVEGEIRWMGFDGGPGNGGKWLHAP
eukprot:1195268-Prorocentrum_minimum.AAC.5